MRLRYIEAIKAYAGLLGLITAFTIFFQFHLALSGGLINLNLADPFALLALVTLGISMVLSRTIPQWRFPDFNRILVLFGALLLLAYVIGWMRIGNTQWAFSARIVGYAVLLGYLSSGYLLVAYIGNKGVRRLLEALATAAVLVIISTVVARLLYGYGFDVPKPNPNFEGFSENRNAFAFQLLAILALSLPYSKIYARQFVAKGERVYKAWRSWLPIGFMITGILWSASRAGMLAVAIMLLVAYYKNALDRKSTLLGVLFALLIWGMIWTAQIPLGKEVIQSEISGEDSNNERWTTLVYGIEMWRHSPFIGEGLGVFIANSSERFGHPTVIHNTPIWILAEFGFLGFVVFGWFYLKLWLYAVGVNSSGNSLARAALLLLLILFAVFSQFHEMLFQRVIWLIGGALLGSPLALGSQSSTKAD